MIYSWTFKTSLGKFRLKAMPKGLYSLEGPGRRETRPCPSKGKPPRRIQTLLKEAASKISSYLSGRKVDLGRLRVDWTAYGGFEKKVLQELRKVPCGKTESYQSLARRAGNPKAARAVGQILHRNRLPFVLPCHRIIPKGGGLGGFSKGVGWKRRLLKLEESLVDKIA